MSSKNKNATTLTIGEGVSLTASESSAVQSALTSFGSGDYSTLAKSARSAFVRYAGGERKSRAMARVYGAIAVVAGIESGQISDSGKPGEGQVSLTAWAKSTGTTQSNASALRNLGRAIQSGYGPAFPSWSYASDKAGNKDVAAVLTSGKSGEAIDRAIGALRSQPAAPRNVDKGGKSAQPDKGTESAPTPVDNYRAALDAIKSVDDTLKSGALTVEQSARVVEMLARLVKRESTLAAKSTKVAKVA